MPLSVPKRTNPWRPLGHRIIRGVPKRHGAPAAEEQLGQGSHPKRPTTVGLFHRHQSDADAATKSRVPTAALFP